MIFLDEPTSNIDSLNEGMILRSLEQEKNDKELFLKYMNYFDNLLTRENEFAHFTA